MHNPGADVAAASDVAAVSGVAGGMLLLPLLLWGPGIAVAAAAAAAAAVGRGRNDCWIGMLLLAQDVAAVACRGCNWIASTAVAAAASADCN